ncbi:hypothetical protein [Pedobacter punctiformis]|uniref:Phage tail protein n=1 Tax=Pedobacter punctiformis TaxID=3004097 RepID=A0ABT4LCU8_9SPHI|nr:hypothetical protein [Pedobacter sp. HCMS5-2]MCZ4244983.1 hypothetical protein [Pedobacter sp. HCMS5-2]
MGSKLNNKDLESVFGVIIESDGLNEFLAFPKRKDSLNHNWPEVNGKDIDLSNPTFEARKFTLKCVLTALGSTDQIRNDNFWSQYNGLFTELSGVGTHEIYLASIDKTFIAYYVDQQSVSKITHVDQEKKLIIKFDIIFQESDPFANIQKVYLVDQDDTFLIA